ncbi:DgyrCDS11104 [Dimorphilus gyrociliatus]|uniref:DgyrCDS11104 n=1 Tax=Dimorphilus gyrociliatus TaxID=2664684 RepID=A0A7I8W3C5_9ANNE|nr:DgyrCDS11104 [Dimorphilus gyrociliatus]
MKSEYTKLNQENSTHKKSKLRICGGLLTVLIGAAIGVGLPLLIVLSFSQTFNYAPVIYQGTSKSTYGKFGTVASDEQHCSSLGTNIMAKKGGSAVDAAIITLLCLGVVSPMSSGLGGGHIMLIYGEHEVVSEIAREKAPLAASEELFERPSNESMYGGRAIAVPGEIAGLHKAWSKFGKLPWSDLFEPIIKLAEGFPVQHALAEAFKKNFDMLKSSPSLSKTFLKHDGSIYKEGEILKRENLAESLKKISKEGAKAFYNGSLTEDILLDLQDHGSIIKKEDLNQFEAYFARPVKSNLSSLNITVYSPPPPSSGPAYQLMLNLLDHLNLSPQNISEFEKSVDLYHSLIEIFKFGFAAKSFLGDPSFNRFMNHTVEDMLSESTIKRILSKIDMNRTHDVPYYEPAGEISETHGTTHVAVISPNGDAVSVTSTINLSFGSRKVGERTGIIFNNQMDDFSRISTKENFWGALNSPANQIRPGKRPQSSTCGSIFTDFSGNVKFVVGASGGTKIPPAVLTVSAFALWLQKDVDDAVNIARFHHQLMPNRVLYESALPKSLIQALKKRGHKMVEQSPELGVAVCQAIKSNCSTTNLWDATNICLHSVSDFRKSGGPDAY